jgi:ribosomal protein S18 acetylase RimI-like enzyme
MIRGKIKEAFGLIVHRQYFEFLSRLSTNLATAPILRLGKLHLLTLRIDLPPKKPVNCNYLIRRASPEDLEAIVGCSREDPDIASLKLFSDYFHSGNSCYVIERNKSILGFAWVFANFYLMTFDGYVNNKIKVAVPKTVAFVGNVFVNRNYRQQGLYSQLLSQIMADQHMRGVDHIAVTVKANNAVSLVAHQRRGFCIANTLYYVSISSLSFLAACPQGGRVQFHRTKRGMIFSYAYLSNLSLS